MRSCSEWRLYVIVDRQAIGSRPIEEVAHAAIRGGADVLQLRDKRASTKQLIEEAQVLLPLARSAGIPLLINDRIDVALAVKADGVHLGQEDLSISTARVLLGREYIIGQSTHSLKQALAVDASAAADYLAVGPVFPTPTKPDYPCVGVSLIRQVASSTKRPFVCIGSIDANNLEEVVQAGAVCVAVVRAVCGASDPESATRNLKNLVTQFLREKTMPAL